MVLILLLLHNCITTHCSLNRSSWIISHDSVIILKIEKMTMLQEIPRKSSHQFSKWNTVGVSDSHVNRYLCCSIESTVNSCFVYFLALILTISIAGWTWPDSPTLHTRQFTMGHEEFIHSGGYIFIDFPAIFTGSFNLNCFTLGIST